jgi:hypothetical protein
MQSGALIEGPSILEFMLSNRLCITAPSSGGPTWETWDEKILELIPNKGNIYKSHSTFIRFTTTTVPIIVVYTKFDLVSSVDREGEEGEEFTERNYKDIYGEVIERHDALRQIPYTVVTSTSTFGLLCLHLHLPTAWQPETLQRLVEITRENMQLLYGKMIQSPVFGHYAMSPNNSVLNNERSSEEENPSDPAQVALAIAQQVDMTSKTATSIK